jgi:hypothetical protein
MGTSAAANIPMDHLPEQRPRILKRGYPRLAAAMAWDPALMVMPRFRELNALNLLCLQAEITDLEEKLNNITWEDDHSVSPDARSYSCNFDKLREHGKDCTQWCLYLDLRVKLQEYSKLLSRLASVYYTLTSIWFLGSSAIDQTDC